VCNAKLYGHSLHRVVATWLLLLLSVWLVSGCSSVSVTTQSLSQPSSEPTLDASLVSTLAEDATAAIPALILAERTASATADLATLSLLWHSNARIVDGRNTSDPADDYIWQNRMAILDRYKLAVFPNPPPPFEDIPAFDIRHDEFSATVVNGVDEWQFVYTDGRWWITELAYQRP